MRPSAPGILQNGKGLIGVWDLPGLSRESLATFPQSREQGPAGKEEGANFPYVEMWAVNSFKGRVVGELERNGKWWVTPLGGTWWALSFVSPSADQLGPWWGLQQASETGPPERQGTGSAANRQHATSCMCQALCRLYLCGLCGHEGDTVLPPRLAQEEADCSRSSS